MYEDDKSLMKAMFKEVEWEEQIICESCSKRESGKKLWERTKRK